MASPLYVAQNGTYEEFLEVYDLEANCYVYGHFGRGVWSLIGRGVW